LSTRTFQGRQDGPLGRVFCWFSKRAPRSARRFLLDGQVQPKANGSKAPDTTTGGLVSCETGGKLVGVIGNPREALCRFESITSTGAELPVARSAQRQAETEKEAAMK